MIYFDQAATSFPKPRGMVAEMESCLLHYCGNPGRSGHQLSLQIGEQVYHARKQLARLLGVQDAARLIMTKNTTESLNLAMRGVLQPGDHVITTVMEHNSVYRPLTAMAKDGVRFTCIKGDCWGRVFPEAIEAAIEADTKLLVMTAASNVTGTIMPFQSAVALAKAKGLLTLIDGAQLIGAQELHLDATGADLIAFPGHKALLGPPGTGCLYVAAKTKLRPLLCGGTGTASKDFLQPEEYPDGYEAGTINGPGIIGLGYAAEALQQIGIKTIAFHERALIEELEQQLRNMDFVTCYGPPAEERVGICLFNLRGKSSEEVTSRLSREYGICVRGGYHCAPLAHEHLGTGADGAVRISTGPFNTRKEVRKVVEAIFRIGREY